MEDQEISGTAEAGIRTNEEGSTQKKAVKKKQGKKEKSEGESNKHKVTCKGNGTEQSQRTLKESKAKGRVEG